MFITVLKNLKEIGNMTQKNKWTNSNRVFYFFDKETADSISKEGRKLIREIYLKKERDDTGRKISTVDGRILLSRGWGNN